MKTRCYFANRQHLLQWIDATKEELMINIDLTATTIDIDSISKPKQDTYKATAICANCEHIEEVTAKKGNRLSLEYCSQCECQGLIKHVELNTTILINELHYRGLSTGTIQSLIDQQYCKEKNIKR